MDSLATPRKALPPPVQDLGAWPTVDMTALSEDHKLLYRRREEAVRRYAQGEALYLIEAMTGIRRGHLYKLLKRCAARHPDGRIFGFRALLPHLRTQPYVRRQTTRASTPTRRSGASGAMTQLLERYDTLTTFLERQIQLRKVYLGDRGEVHGLHATHREFLNQCRALNLTNKHYPFNQELKGIRSLGNAIRRLATQTFGQAAQASGASHVQPGRGPDDTPGVPAAKYPFEVVEFDGHKLNVRLRVRIKDPLGYEQNLELERVWLLALLDVCTRVVLGWHLALSAEYNRHDVIKALESALKPRRKRASFSISGLHYEPRGGFASEVIRQTEYATWEWLRYDNARCHLAADTLAMVCDSLGCHVDAGPYGEPNERPYIERFFGTVGSTLSNRLPGTTGANPQDVRRALSDIGSKTEMLLSIDELAELLDVTFANYNGSPHDGLGGRSPLEAMEYHVRDRRTPLRTLSEPYRHNLLLLQPAHISVVRGNLRRGVRPYINLFGVRYSSAVLGEAAKHIGQSIRIHFDPDDMRVVMAYFANGAEIGPLKAHRPWDQTAHSLRLRQEILRLKRLKEVDYGETKDPVEVYFAHQRRQIKSKKRRTGHRAAEAARVLEQAASPEDRSSATSTVVAPATNSGLVKPRTLSIGKGQIMR